MRELRELTYPRKYYAIKLADHGKTLFVEGRFEDLSEIVNDIRNLKAKSKIDKVSIIKVKGFRLEPLRKVWNAQKFDILFEVQAEHVPSQDIHMVVRSSLSRLPIGVPLAFSSPPVDIRAN